MRLTKTISDMLFFQIYIGELWMAYDMLNNLFSMFLASYDVQLNGVNCFYCNHA